MLILLVHTRTGRTVAKFTALTYELPVEHGLSLSAGISQH